MTYKEFTFTISSREEFHKDLLINALSEIGFNTFEDFDLGFKGYIPSSDLDQEKLDSLSEKFTGISSFTYIVNTIPHQNWNELWESNFEPLQVSNRCYIRATFHEPHPEYEFEIVIDPKMAFGTGHHQTTALMIECMLEENFHGQKVLDMGCGTGILGILASKMGAKEIIAIDYDDICYESTKENAGLNGIRNIKSLCGSKEVIPGQKFNIILANINRNILIDQLEKYSEVSDAGGLLFLSGFYEEPDLAIIRQKAESKGFKYRHHKTLNDWVVVKFISY